MDTIRYATPEEIQAIAPNSDLSQVSTSVVTFGGKDYAVLRQAFEVDPVHFAEDSPDRRKVWFLMNIETALRLQGIKEFYLNARADDPQWIEVLKHWGAEPVSPTPEIRFKKVL